MRTLFSTIYDGDREDVCSSCGSPFRDLYAFDEKGELFKSGTENRYELIQSHKASTELATLLQRYAQGDETALNQSPMFFDDATQYPSTFAELYERMQEAERSFNGLPDGLREMFNNSPVEFWQSVGTPEFIAKADKYNQSQRSKKKADSRNDSGGGNRSDNSVSGNGGNLNESQSE